MKNGYWNYTEPIQYRVVEVKLLTVPQTPLHWQNVFAGEVRQAVEITHNGRSFLIDNADGSGLKKIAAGGGPDSMSRHIDANEFVGEVPEEKVQQWDLSICKKIDGQVDEWQQRNYPAEYQKLQGLKESMAAMRKNRPGWMTGCVIMFISLFASCVPAQRGPYGCPKDVTKAVNLPVNKYWFNSDCIALRIDSCIGRTWVLIPPDSVLRIGIVLNQSHYVVPYVKPKPDTIPEWMHISMRPKGFVVSMMALSIREGDYCIAHLDCAGKPFPEHYKVGWCQGKEQLLTRLVEERRVK